MGVESESPKYVCGDNGRSLLSTHPTAIRFSIGARVMTPEGVGTVRSYSNSGYVAAGTGIWVRLDKAPSGFVWRHTLRRYKVNHETGESDCIVIDK